MSDTQNMMDYWRAEWNKITDHSAATSLDGLLGSGRETVPYWKPLIYSDGGIYYVAENGKCTAKSLAELYDITADEAERILKNAGVNDVTAGTRISGNDVDAVTGESRDLYRGVLKMRWEAASTKQKIYHIMFAILCSGRVRKNSSTDMKEFVTGLHTSNGVPAHIREKKDEKKDFQIPLVNGKSMEILSFNSIINMRDSVLKAGGGLIEKSGRNGVVYYRHDYVLDKDVPRPLYLLAITIAKEFINLYSESYYD